ncbi:heavy metal translocating P-type ATPase [Melioribacteraceae bacterium 4301-Me]|uniref:heavy metal translocating P-type ATPase n=1 Tax=Pyranulibacter aquaticus TaxID=3163344 RepID=UPI003594EF49
MKETITKEKAKEVKCFHCGEDCVDNEIRIDEKVFCCNGCKNVYLILNNNQMCTYYSLEEKPGVSQKNHVHKNYDFLDDETIQQKLVDFSSSNFSSITFFIPQMHCSSCIWLLESLYKLNNGIKNSQVDFLKKRLTVNFNPTETKIKNIVQLLNSLGYEPQLNLEDKEKETSQEQTKKLYYKIGIAGFCFGNIMLLSFPEYLSITQTESQNLNVLFNYLMLLLSLPVFFYSANEYHISAIKGLKKKIVNIDVPVSLGILILFIRSFVDIVFYNQAGYLDSLSGLVFFLLIGRLFQNKTYYALNFERNYKSFFPISACVIRNGKETTIPIEKIEPGERMLIRNNEIIAVDSILIKGIANIDYSFVTGESSPVTIKNGDLIYAGGKQIGTAIEVESIKNISQSYLTQLWNNKAFLKQKESKVTSLANKVSKYFTFIVLFIALSSAIYWSLKNPAYIWIAVTSVLIVACPCALALSTPFTLGNILRIFGKNKFYIKNTAVIEELAKIDSIVFDKTGTLTEQKNFTIEFVGTNLTDDEKILIKSTTRNSTHPLSQKIFNSINTKYYQPDEYYELPGEGIEAKIFGNCIKLGSQQFVNSNNFELPKDYYSKVFISINNVVKGYYKISNNYRDGLKLLFEQLKRNYSITILSGDNPSEKNNLFQMFGLAKNIFFNQTPYQKLMYVGSLQNAGKKVLMIGDGLNDAGALKKSNVGISVTENTNNFSPSSDAILEASSLKKLSLFLRFCKTGEKIIIASFVISFVYNLVGLSFAVQGLLSPLIAAILMPISSISVVVFTTFTTNFFAKKSGLI